MNANDERDEERGDMAGRLPSLEEQTPGLDTAQVQQTDKDAEAFFSKDADTGEQASSEKFAQAAGRGRRGRGDAAGRGRTHGVRERAETRRGDADKAVGPLPYAAMP